jgi:hypothetical protein
MLAALLGARAGDVLISCCIVAVIFLALLGPSCGPEAWFVLLMIPLAPAALLFGGFFVGRLMRKVAPPD